MANKYSSLYSRPADKPAGPFNYAGPVAQRVGDQIARSASISGAVANADVLYIAGGFVPGETIIGVNISHSGDSNITAANLVLRPRDGTADIVLVAASAVLDGAVNTSLDFAGLANATIPDNGKEYDLCWIAGSAGGAVVHAHVVRSAL